MAPHFPEVLFQPESSRAHGPAVHPCAEHAAGVEVNSRAGTSVLHDAPPFRLRALLQLRPRVSGELAILLASVYFALFNNAAFWRAVEADPLREPRWTATLLVLLVSSNALIMSLLAWRRLAKPAIGLLVVVSAIASHYSLAYGVHIDTEMLANVVHSDARESAEFLSKAALMALLSSAPALFVLWRIRTRKLDPGRALARRLAFAAGLVVVALVAALGSSRELTSLVRNHRETRYLASPANVVVSLAKLANEAGAQRAGPRRPVAADAALLPQGAHGSRPRLLVLVVGETARAANWGLGGYDRQTTPALARTRGVVNFPQVTACGSSTEVSVPCMFSIQGREHYDRRAIRGEESLLHVLARVGVSVLWRDNQSGCKGVCDGLPTQRLQGAHDARYCSGPSCLDGILFDHPEAWLGDGSRPRVVVLHMLGNHGPRYGDRYPADFARYRPACASAELDECGRESIVNAYDNALLYSDHLLAAAIDLLGRQQAYDAALLYVSDHGESLGENGLYLHGMPWSIAPDVQTRVPMVAWLSPGFAASAGIDTACLARTASRPLTHDHLFHSVLGAMGVATRAYRSERDIFAPCRDPSTTARLVPRELRA